MSVEYSMTPNSSRRQSISVSTRKTKVRNVLQRRWQAIKDDVRELFTFHPGEWRDAFRRNSAYPIFTKGDVDGLVALFIDNMATLLTIILGLQTVLDVDIVYGKIVPG